MQAILPVAGVVSEIVAAAEAAPTATAEPVAPAAPVSARAEGRRAARAAARPPLDETAVEAAASGAIDAIVVDEPHAPSISVEASLPAEPVAAVTVAPAAPAAPTSRRASRAQRPAPVEIVAEPELAQAIIEPHPVDETLAFRTAPIQPPAEPAPLLDPVLTPAEPFALLEPVVEAAEPVVETPAAVEPEPIELIAEPFVAATPVAEPAPAPQHEARNERVAAPGTDEFEAAARLFAFTGELPTQDVIAEVEAETEESPAAHRVSRGARRASAFKRATAVSFSVGVMGVVGLLTVGMTTPAEAVAAASGNQASLTVLAAAGTDAEVSEEDVQAYVAPATTENASIVRNESYSMVTNAELAMESGITNFSNFFTNDPNSAIQWPFAVGVPITYGFGMRSGRMHEGADFVPGAGSPIQAIADGVVRVATNAGGAYGVHVIIDHVIDGQLVSSHYAHMQYGSLAVTPGQSVTVGTMLGRTGNTGRSYGAHTHFEILMGGTTPIDPIPWLREHAGG